MDGFWFWRSDKSVLNLSDLLVPPLRVLCLLCVRVNITPLTLRPREDGARRGTAPWIVLQRPTPEHQIPNVEIGCEFDPNCLSATCSWFHNRYFVSFCSRRKHANVNPVTDLTNVLKRRPSPRCPLALKTWPASHYVACFRRPQCLNAFESNGGTLAVKWNYTGPLFHFQCPKLWLWKGIEMVLKTSVVWNEWTFGSSRCTYTWTTSKDKACKWVFAIFPLTCSCKSAQL